MEQARIYGTDTWDETMAAIEMSRRAPIGVNVPITEDVYEYFLGVLPPKRWPEHCRRDYPIGEEGAGLYAFAERMEEITIFWQEGDKYFARRTDRINGVHNVRHDVPDVHLPDVRNL